MQIFYHQKDRLPLRFGVQPGPQRGKGALALPLGREGEGRVGRGQRERQQCRQEGHRLGQHNPRRGQQGFQPVQGRRGRIPW